MSGADAIRQAAKLYEASDTMLRLYGETRFQAKVAEYRPYIEAIMRAQAEPNALAAGIELGRRLQAGGGSAVMIVCALGTAVEMIEPHR